MKRSKIATTLGWCQQLLLEVYQVDHYWELWHWVNNCKSMHLWWCSWTVERSEARRTLRPTNSTIEVLSRFPVDFAACVRASKKAGWGQPRFNRRVVEGEPSGGENLKEWFTPYVTRQQPLVLTISKLTWTFKTSHTEIFFCLALPTLWYET